jgi:hypothetical protein
LLTHDDARRKDEPPKISPTRAFDVSVSVRLVALVEPVTPVSVSVLVASVVVDDAGRTTI